MNLDEYEREGQALYMKLAATVAGMLTTAIEADGGFRLQQVAHRAKQVDSLRRKLVARGIVATENLESDVKDLAGCRVIFYTNGDVSRVLHSGIINEIFEIVDAKVHHPKRDADDPADLYISNHYIVRLRPEQVAYSENAQFAGMRCEVQIQTILNHAWAEMAHDTIYKAPAIGHFGGKAFDAIRERMRKVARRYIVPAGYEFQKIDSDFQRLVKGKALFDGDALEAIVAAEDNNVRADRLDTFLENVLPLYDDLGAVYTEVVTRLVEAARRARSMLPVAIETPYGTLFAKTFRDIVAKTCEILTRYRYLDIASTFDAMRTLYSYTESDDERKPLIDLGESLAKHELDIWRRYGPVVQGIIVDRIEALGDDERRALSRLLNAMLSEILGAEITGTTSSSNAVSLHHGPVAASHALRGIRSRAIALLQRQFALAENEVGRQAALLALQVATRAPNRGAYSNALAELVMDNTVDVIQFETEVAATLTMGLRQQTEAWIHRAFWSYEALPPSMREDPDLERRREQIRAAALEFRDVANADPEFVAYKTLVGFDSVFPPAWKDRVFKYEEASAYRAKQMDALLASVEERDADAWYERLSRYAQTDASDATTFAFLGKFLERLAVDKPMMVFGIIDRLERPLADFIPAMIAGLMRSAEAERAQRQIEEWLDAGRYLREIAWYLRFAERFDEALLARTCEIAVEKNDRRAVLNTVLAAATQFTSHRVTLIDRVLLPALRYLSIAGDFGWVRFQWNSWLNSPIIRALDETQARIVLDVLVPYPKLEYDAEYIVAAIAEKWPAAVVDFVGRRQIFARSEARPSRYDAVPYEVHELRAPLAAVPDITLRGARTWFESDPEHFDYDGGLFVASIFPQLENGLGAIFSSLIDGGDERDRAFLLGVLSGFKGQAFIYDFVKSIVAKLHRDSPLRRKAWSVLCESGVVCGEFGHADLYAERRNLLQPWLNDENETVRSFAAELIGDLDRWVAAETRSAEASIALRRLEYGEDVSDGKAELKRAD